MVVRYFAYGSNMDHARLVERVGPVAADAAVPARLVDHRLSFSKRSRTAGGAATVHPEPAALVEGVVWTIDHAQLLRLDVVEGVPDHYGRIEVPLLVDAGELVAWTYVAHPARVAAGLRPTATYLGHLLRGERWLSPSYVQGLRATPTDA